MQLIIKRGKRITELVICNYNWDEYYKRNVALLGYLGDLPFSGWSETLPSGRHRPTPEGRAGVGLVLEAFSSWNSPATVLLACVTRAS